MHDASSRPHTQTSLESGRTARVTSRDLYLPSSSQRCWSFWLKRPKRPWHPFNADQCISNNVKEWSDERPPKPLYKDQCTLIWWRRVLSSLRIFTMCQRLCFGTIFFFWTMFWNDLTGEFYASTWVFASKDALKSGPLDEYRKVHHTGSNGNPTAGSQRRRTSDFFCTDAWLHCFANQTVNVINEMDFVVRFLICSQ